MSLKMQIIENIKMEDTFKPVRFDFSVAFSFVS